MKAYRRAAQKWHPDNFQGDEKKVAEKRFIDVAAAKEVSRYTNNTLVGSSWDSWSRRILNLKCSSSFQVLTDPEKRAQYDAGDDPLDPENGRGGQGGNPFHHFHHGSPFQFKFHFN